MRLAYLPAYEQVHWSCIPKRRAGPMAKSTAAGGGLAWRCMDSSDVGGSVLRRYSSWRNSSTSSPHCRQRTDRKEEFCLKNAQQTGLGLAARGGTAPPASPAAQQSTGAMYGHSWHFSVWTFLDFGQHKR